MNYTLRDKDGKLLTIWADSHIQAIDIARLDYNFIAVKVY